MSEHQQPAINDTRMVRGEIRWEIEAWSGKGWVSQRWVPTGASRFIDELAVLGVERFRRIAELESMLRKVTWNGPVAGDDRTCVCCGGLSELGHRLDCRLFHMLPCEVPE